MTLDNHPAWWRRMVKLYLLWMDLPDDRAEQLLNVLPELEQQRFDIYLQTALESPSKVLKNLEKQIDHGEIDEVDSFINKLPKEELKKLVKAGLKRGNLVTNIDKMEIEELQTLVQLCSFPKNILTSICFIDSLDSKRKRYLAGKR